MVPSLHGSRFAKIALGDAEKEDAATVAADVELQGYQRTRGGGDDASV